MRKGKLNGTTKVIIPYFDTDGYRQYSLITLNGTLYASKVYAGIRQFVRDNFGTEVDTDWLHNVPLIANEHDPEAKVSDTEWNHIMESLIDRWELKDDEIEDLADTGDSGEDACEAEKQMLTMPCDCTIGVGCVCEIVSRSLPCNR